LTVGIVTAMAYPNVILEAVRLNDNSAIEKLISAVRLAAGANADIEELLRQATTELPANRLLRPITGTVELPQPAQSLEDWCEELRCEGINPMPGIHYREVDRKLYKNTNPI
jgi:hypothetical protein